MKTIEEMKMQIESLYEQAIKEKDELKFQDAQDMEFDLEMMIIDYTYGLPRD